MYVSTDPQPGGGVHSQYRRVFPVFVEWVADGDESVHRMGTANIS